jgi:1-acyl-sn-glycerol-3-phosphate acyltransferase
MMEMNSILKRIGWWLYQPYKWLFMYPFFILNSIIFGLVAVVLSMIFGHKIGSRVCGVTWAFINTLLTPAIIRVRGRDRVNRHQSYVIVSNHMSAFDIVAIYGWIGIDFKWVMKKEVRKIPGVGFGSAAIGHIFIDRSNTKNAIASIHAARKRITNGTSVLFFPEGTRSKDGRLLPFKKGAFRLAHELALPILPVTIRGTDRIMPSGTLDLMPGKAEILIHEPLEVSEYDPENVATLMQEVRARIASGLKDRDKP